MRSLIPGLFCLTIAFAQAQSTPAEVPQDNKSAVNMDVLKTEPEAQELNTAPNPTPDAAAESEAFPGTLTTEENYPIGPYDREGQYMYKEPPHVREAQEALDAQEEKQQELERVHGEELLDYSTRPKE